MGQVIKFSVEAEEFFMELFQKKRKFNVNYTHYKVTGPEDRIHYVQIYCRPFNNQQQRSFMCKVYEIIDGEAVNKKNVFPFNDFFGTREHLEEYIDKIALGYF